VTNRVWRYLINGRGQTTKHAPAGFPQAFSPLQIKHNSVFCENCDKRHTASFSSDAKALFQRISLLDTVARPRSLLGNNNRVFGCEKQDGLSKAWYPATAQWTAVRPVCGGA
jgi:hypothetical protein